MGPKVIKPGWQADLQPDQSPFILNLGSVTLQAANPNPTPLLQMDPKACKVALLPQNMWGDSLVAGLATVKVMRSGVFLPQPQQEEIT